MTKKTGFTTISFKTPVVKRFRQFSKQVAPDHSEALSIMLDFFHYNELSPRERFGPTGRRIEDLIKRRNNAVIAIMRSIEKNGINPTLGMMQTLFDGVTSKVEERPLMREKKKLSDSERGMFREKKFNKGQ